MVTAATRSPVRSFCPLCKANTNHDVIEEVKRHYTPANTPDMQIDFYWHTLQIVACRGCETYSFRQEVVCSEDIDSHTGAPETRVTSYPGAPPTTIVPEHEIKALGGTPPTVRRIYRETIEAFNRDMHTLAAGGLRALVEAICADKGIADGPVEVAAPGGGTKVVRNKKLVGKIAGLAEKGYLTEQHAKALHEHRFMGNDALHELRVPEAEDISLAIELVEHTLENLYELKPRAEFLAERRRVAAARIAASSKVSTGGGSGGST